MIIKVERKRMGSNHQKGYIIRWMMPGSVLILLIILMMIYFSVKGKQAEQKDFNKKLITQAEVNANTISGIINGIQISAGTMANYRQQELQGNVNYGSMLKSIVEESGAYNAVVCTDDGTAYLYDGTTVQIDKTDYFQGTILEETRVTFTKDDGIEGRESIVIVVPIQKEENASQYFICYYDLSEFGKIVKREDFGDSSFCLLLDRNGRVIVTDSSEASNFCRETEDYFSLLKEDVANQKTVEGLWIRALNGETGIGYYAIKGEKRAILVTSVADNDFYFVVGVDCKYIDAAVEVQWSGNAGMVRQIMITMLIFVGVVIVINIITKVKENENSRKLADIADTDVLTDLYNKAATEREIKQYLAEHPNDKGLMLVLDIDNFKKINDTMGHAFGDEVLHTFGIQIRAQFRANDIVGRTGGDEFTVYVHDIKNHEAIQSQAKRIEEFFHNFQAGEYVKYSATASIGAAIYPDDAHDFEGLYKAADHALYVAKRRGKNRLTFYGDENN
ncbi:MAG TPA: diguanylate cyclase [Lachnospiraceae bacterium]|nr:diguanylate cyclase [Lachnospiraceae bacterium]